MEAYGLYPLFFHKWLKIRLFWPLQKRLLLRNLIFGPFYAILIGNSCEAVFGLGSFIRPFPRLKYSEMGEHTGFRQAIIH